MRIKYGPSPDEYLIYYGGDLRLKHHTDLRSLPNNLNVSGGLFLENCPALRELPKGLVVNSLTVDECDSLHGLPDDICVEGRILVQNCDSFSRVASRSITVNGDLALANCPALKELPDSLVVLHGGLWLDGCVSLTHLPNDISVDYTIDLDGCTGITHLPENLEIGANLYLNGCASLTEIPAGFKIGKGKIYIDNNTGLFKKFPTCVYTDCIWETYRFLAYISTERQKWCDENDIQVTEKYFDCKPFPMTYSAIEDAAQRMLYQLKWG